MGKRIVLTEYPNLENYPKVETMLDSESMCGYTQRTTFWDDFTLAEKLGLSDIERTYRNAFNSWKTDVVFITELVLVLNWKMLYMDERHMTEKSAMYYKCWVALSNWGKRHLEAGASESVITVTARLLRW